MFNEESFSLIELFENPVFTPHQKQSSLIINRFDFTYPKLPLYTPTS